MGNGTSYRRCLWEQYSSTPKGVQKPNSEWQSLKKGHYCEERAMKSHVRESVGIHKQQTVRLTAVLTAEWLCLDLHAVCIWLFLFIPRWWSTHTQMQSNGHNSQLDRGLTWASLLVASQEVSGTSFRGLAVCVCSWVCLMFQSKGQCLWEREKRNGVWHWFVSLRHKGNAGERWETAWKSKVSP